MTDPASFILYGDPTATQEDFAPATNYDPATQAAGKYYTLDPSTGAYQEWVPGTPMPEGTQLYTQSGTSPYTPPPASASAASGGSTGGNPAGGGGGSSTTSNIASGTAAVQAILALIGLGNAKANDGTPLAQWLLSQATASGLDPTTIDPTALQAWVDVELPQQKVYQDRFPGIMQQLALGENPISPVDYIAFEDTARGLATQYGLDYNTVFTPDAIAKLVVGKVSGNELQSRMGTYLDAYESAPTQVQQAYDQFYGVNGPTAFAMQIANPTVTDDQLKLETEAANIQGASTQLNLNVGQSRAEQLGRMGVSYASALNALHTVTAEKGLYTPTVGEGQAASGPGAQTPVTANDQGISSAFGLSSIAEQQVNWEKAQRAKEFQGGGGGSQTSNVGDFGAGSAHVA